MIHVTHPHILHMPFKAPSYQSLSKGISKIVLGRDLTNIYYPIRHISPNYMISTINMLRSLVVSRLFGISDCSSTVTTEGDNLVCVGDYLKVRQELTQPNSFFRSLGRCHILSFHRGVSNATLLDTSPHNGTSS